MNPTNILQIISWERPGRTHTNTFVKLLSEISRTIVKETFGKNDKNLEYIRGGGLEKISIKLTVM